MAAISQMQFREWNFCILIKISQKFVSMCQIDNTPAMV